MCSRLVGAQAAVLPEKHSRERSDRLGRAQGFDYTCRDVAADCRSEKSPAFHFAAMGKPSNPGARAHFKTSMTSA